MKSCTVNPLINDPFILTPLLKSKIDTPHKEGRLLEILHFQEREQGKMFSEMKFLNKRPFLINTSLSDRSKYLNKRPGRLLEDLR